MSLDSLMQSIYDEYNIPDLGPDEFTIPMYRDRFGIGQKAAERQIAAALADGRIVEAGRRSPPEGKPAMAYRIAV